ncbi:MAG TPA: hypothetical protein VMW01_17260 [Williamwhitmania sp.]|nr:hypothetical protein [Williamwhitmania sp.]
MRILLSTLLLASFSTMLNAQTPDSTLVVKDTVQHSTDTVGVSKVRITNIQHVAVDSATVADSLKQKKTTSNATFSNVPDSSAVEVANINNNVKTDTIVMLSGKKILANFMKFTLKNLYYSFPGETKMVEVDRREVNKIIYKSGRVDIISTREVEIPDIPGWRDVKVVHKPEQVADMNELGEVEAYAIGERDTYATPKWLERSATITLQKKAALLGAQYVLITNRVVRTPYGDPASISLTGKAYKRK